MFRYKLSFEYNFSLEIVMERYNKLIMKYIPDAMAETNAIDDFNDLQNQRENWIASDWFAWEHIIRNYRDKME